MGPDGAAEGGLEGWDRGKGAKVDAMEDRGGDKAEVRDLYFLKARKERGGDRSLPEAWADRIAPLILDLVAGETETRTSAHPL